jgi:hypothetical protein
MSNTNPAATPALPSAADPTPYVPVSWMAVTAIGVAGCFVVVLIVLGASAFLAKKPLIQPELLVFAVAGMVLSFAGRRVIRNSEGTRTGENLVNAAWWISVIVGLGYTAYLFAIEYSIRRDAEVEVQRWVEWAIKGDPADLDKAFVRTLPPGRRVGLGSANSAQLQAEFGDEYVAFGQVDIVRLGKRSPGACRFVPRALKDWTYRASGIECVITGVIESPEGQFPVEVPLKGVEAGAGGGVELAGRQWSVTLQPSGYVVRNQVKITPYGQLMAEVEQSGNRLANLFIDGTNLGLHAKPLLYRELMKQPAQSASFFNVLLTSELPAITVLGGPVGMYAFTAEYETYLREQAFRLPGGVAPTPDLNSRFLNLWNITGLFPPGRRIPMNENIDGQLDLRVTEDRVELRVPCEVPLPSLDGTITGTARGRLLLVCTDAELLAELKKLRSEATPSSVNSPSPSREPLRPLPWRVVRLESNLQPAKGNNPRQSGQFSPMMSGGG